MKHVLSNFQSLSGLGASYNKSEMYCSGISEDLKSQLATVMGIRLGTLPVKYLWVPIFAGNLQIKDYAPITEKTTARIKSWSSSFLSFAGRLQLIKFVLSSLYQYWCNVIPLP